MKIRIPLTIVAEVSRNWVGIIMAFTVVRSLEPLVIEMDRDFSPIWIMSLN